MRETVMASSVSLGGATLLSRKLTNLSITKANAKTEQATRGQMGQPAACMIENKAITPASNLGWIMA